MLAGYFYVNKVYFLHDNNQEVNKFTHLYKTESEDFIFYDTCLICCVNATLIKISNSIFIQSYEILVSA